MIDGRFDRVFFVKTQPNEMEKMKQLCIDYHINDNGVFDNAASFHFAWAIGSEGLIYISPTTFLINKPDFNSIEELEDYLDKFEVLN